MFGQGRLHQLVLSIKFELLYGNFLSDVIQPQDDIGVHVCTYTVTDEENTPFEYVFYSSQGYFGHSPSVDVCLPPQVFFNGRERNESHRMVRLLPDDGLVVGSSGPVARRDDQAVLRRPLHRPGLTALHAHEPQSLTRLIVIYTDSNTRSCVDMWVVEVLYGLPPSGKEPPVAA